MDSLSDDQRRDELSRLEVAWAFADCTQGTLWRVREDLWKECLQDYDSDRRWHPGLCLGTNPVEDQLPIAIMSHGSSGTSGPLVLRGLTEERGQDYPSSFGSLMAPIAGIEFVTTAPDADPEDLSGPWWKKRRVSVNWHKRRLTEHEQEKFERMLPDWMQG